MTDNLLRDFESRHNMVAYEACRMLGLPYSSYMRCRKTDSLPKGVRLHIEALNLLEKADFNALRAARTSE